MEVTVKPIDKMAALTSQRVAPGENAPKAEAAPKADQAGTQARSAEPDQEKKQLSRDELSEISQELNKFMQLLNANIQFALHEKTQRLMVQVVDTKEQKVLKEFPPHESLDTIAKIRDYVGFLLDKRA